MIENGQRLLNYREVAEVFGVKVMTVRRWQAVGRIRAVKITGKIVRFSREEIDRVVRENTVVVRS